MPVGRWLASTLLVAVCAACSPAVQPAPLPTSAPPTLSPAPTPVATGSPRVDVLAAANSALSSGKMDAAAGLYEYAVNTPPAPTESAAAAQAITDFAHFRAIVAFLATGKEDQARQHVEALQTRDATAPLARLADQFWNQYSMTASVKAACAQIEPQVAGQAGGVLATLTGLGVSVDAANLCGLP